MLKILLCERCVRGFALGWCTSTVCIYASKARRLHVFNEIKIDADVSY